MPRTRWTRYGIAVLVLLGGAATVHAITGDPYLYLPAAGAVAIPLILGPLTEVYEAGSRRTRLLLLGLGGAAVVLVLAFYTRATFASPPQGIDWIAWGVVIAFPLVLGIWVARLALRDLRLD